MPISPPIKLIKAGKIPEAAKMPPRLVMLRRFFQDYKQLEGKSVEGDDIRPATEAYPIIEDALHRYGEQRRKGFKPTG